MKPGIYINKIWFDDDMVELKIDSTDGASLFSNKIYVGHQAIDELISKLNIFKKQIYGGIFDVEFGAFGPEYASGAFHARLHFQDRGKIYVTIHAQSDFENFGIKKVASEATLYVVSEPALLDNFIAELSALKAGERNDATLEIA